MNMIMEDLDTDRHAPEISRQERDVEERRAGEAKQDRRETVEERQNERVPCEVASYSSIPRRAAERRAVEDTRLGTIDEHAPEAELPNDDIQRVFADEKLLESIAQAVERGA